MAKNMIRVEAICSCGASIVDIAEDKLREAAERSADLAIRRHRAGCDGTITKKVEPAR